MNDTPGQPSPGDTEPASPYIDTKELSKRTHYEVRTILNSLKDSVLLEGQHYIRPFGRRKIIWHWPNIQEAMESGLNTPPAPHAQAQTPADDPPKAQRAKGRPRGTVNNRWSENDDAYLRRYFRRKTRMQIATELGKSTSSLAQRIRDLGLIKRQ